MQLVNDNTSLRMLLIWFAILIDRIWYDLSSPGLVQFRNQPAQLIWNYVIWFVFLRDNHGDTNVSMPSEGLLLSGMGGCKHRVGGSSGKGGRRLVYLACRAHGCACG